MGSTITTAEGVSLALAALALGLGFWNAYRDWNLRRAIAARERRANVSVRLELKAKSSCDQLVLVNEGPAAAHHVHVLIDGASLVHHEWFRGEREMNGPLGLHAEYRYDLNWRADKPTEVTVTWADDAKRPGEYRTTLPPGSPPSAASFF